MVFGSGSGLSHTVIATVFILYCYSTSNLQGSQGLAGFKALTPKPCSTASAEPA
jgi:hypothetical protein